MKKTLLLFIGGILAIAANAQYPVASKTFNYTDASRSNRTVSLEFRYPGTSSALANGVFPFVIFAHGFQMDAVPYYPYADSLAKRGYIVGLLTTETGLSPNHPNFGKDLIFMYGKMKEENNNASSFFYQKVLPKGALGGHSMGGGSLILSAQDSVPADCYFTFSPSKATTPACIPVAYKLTKPYLAITGSGDCIAPPATDQRPIYDSARSACKTYINITNGLHCQFGSGNLQCNFGEGFSGCASSPLSRSAQISISLSYLIPFLDYFLKGDCAAWTLFENRYAANTVDQKAMSCNNQIPSNASISGDSTVCEGLSTTLTAQPAGFTYLWNNQTTGQSLQVLGQGTYTVIVGNGTCNLPEVSHFIREIMNPGFVTFISGGNNFCPNSIHTLSMDSNVNATNYTWTLPVGWSFLSDSNRSSVTVRCGDSSGIVTARKNNSCTYSNTRFQSFTVLPATPGSIGTISGLQQVCVDSTYSFSVPNNPLASSYFWSFPSNLTATSGINSESIQLKPLGFSAANTISVYATNGCGNSDTAVLPLVLNRAPKINNLRGDSVVCSGSELLMNTDLTGNGVLIWNTPGFQILSGDSTDSVYVSPSGVAGYYPISVYAHNECGNSSLLFQNVRIADGPFAILTRVQNDLMASATAGVQYFWYRNGQIIPGASDSIYSPAQSGSYQVFVENSDGCGKWSNAVNFTVNGIDGIFSEERLSIFPNPASNVVYISGTVLNESVMINDLTGRVIGVYNTQANITTISTENLSSGSYFVVLGNKRVKLIVERF
ncbi:MAG: T9SS type A sorting domain-containing protein [Chitinophagales bacterium]